MFKKRHMHMLFQLRHKRHSSVENAFVYITSDPSDQSRTGCKEMPFPHLYIGENAFPHLKWIKDIMECEVERPFWTYEMITLSTSVWSHIENQGTGSSGDRTQISQFPHLKFHTLNSDNDSLIYLFQTQRSIDRWTDRQTRQREKQRKKSTHSAYQWNEVRY